MGLWLGFCVQLADTIKRVRRIECFFFALVSRSNKTVFVSSQYFQNLLQMKNLDIWLGGFFGRDLPWSV